MKIPSKKIKILLRFGKSKNTHYILNEAINFEKQIIFIAIPKTGTTSVRSQTKEKGIPLIPNPHMNILQIRDSIYTYLLKTNLGKNTLFPGSSIPSDTDLREKAINIFDSFFKFSAVRNPWARAVSLYYRREGIPMSKKISFEQFIEKHIYASDSCRQPSLHKNQLDWLCDESGKNIMNYIYKVEEFSQATEEIRNLTRGRLVLHNINKNKNPRSCSRTYRNLYTDKTQKLIANHFEKDIDYFKYTF